MFPREVSSENIIVLYTGQRSGEQELMTATFYGVWECDDIIDIDSNKLAMHENVTRVKNRKDLENNQRLSRKTSFQ